ncbi:MAG TPA: hypothetical protein PLJ26_06845 [Candidatus Omnitrophota bacterium]|nr:hypothetical protein [Candidatus Omnitrophota bacterium]HQJ16185.1 hypothetical protein [Candidatus Omnitrophota bacterium]
MRSALVLAALLACILTAGCHTASGAAAGAAAGAQKDYETVTKADAWLQDKLW